VEIVGEALKIIGWKKTSKTGFEFFFEFFENAQKMPDL